MSLLICNLLVLDSDLVLKALNLLVKIAFFRFHLLNCFLELSDLLLPIFEVRGQVGDLMLQLFVIFHLLLVVIRFVNQV